jgi:16S rRNA (guanine966-N2)-methyltransferase
MIKIITGKYKGRVIPTFKDADYRPSTGRFREALFSILTSNKNLLNSNTTTLTESTIGNGIIENSNVLDLFAGTGSLGFEALSRGANTATFVDTNDAYLKHAKAFAEKIGAAEDVKFLKCNATKMPYSSKRYNLVLLDPPYQKDLGSKTLSSLIENKWLENNAIIALEISKKDEINFPEVYSIVDERIYGNSKLIILRYEEV